MSEKLIFQLRTKLTDALTVLQKYGVIFVFLGALALVAAGVWYAINRTLDEWVRWLLVGGLGAWAVYVLLRPQDLRNALRGRSVRYASNALALSIAAIGIVALLNYLSTRYYERFDTTEAKLHSLSPQSIQIVKELDREIEIIGVYPSGRNQDQFEKWIDEYRIHTDRIQYRYIDPIRQPGAADQLGWDAYGAGLIVRRGDRSQSEMPAPVPGIPGDGVQVYTPDEQDITSAFLKVSQDTQKVIYFTTGHNERSPTGSDGADYGDVGTLLERNNYRVETLNLVVTATVPADAAMVIVAGPQTPLFDEEKDRLRDYLLQGGKALILIDPGPETGINAVLEPWQVRIENQVVIDEWSSMPNDPLTPVIDRYQYSQITKDLPMIALPLACPIQQVAQQSTEIGITFTPLAKSSPQQRSWAEADLENLEDIKYDEGTDLPGPLTLIATVESPAADGSGEKTRLVLIGDSDFVSNGVLRQIPNGQFLFLNAVNWLAEEEALIAIGPKANMPRNVQMNVIQQGAVCFGTLILIPAIIVISGVVVWFRRR